MTHQPPRSLKFEYELYVEREIEDYKDALPRSSILDIGDEAVAILRSQEQYGFDELLLWVEVDRIIRRRLRIPSFSTWKRRRLRLLEQYRRPEYWGIHADAPLVRAIQPAADSHVLVAGADVEVSALYLAANGCVVTAVEQQSDAVDRVITAAERVGLSARVNGQVVPLDTWSPDEPLAAVVCTPAAFEGLSREARARAIAVLQSATLDGGVHLVQTIVAGDNEVTIEELRRRYRGWSISVERDEGAARTFLARKSSAA